MINARDGNKSKALKYIEQAETLFDEIYLQNGAKIHVQSHKIDFYKGEIYRMFKEYEDSIYHFNESIKKEEGLKELKEDSTKKSSVYHSRAAPKASKFSMERTKIQAKESNYYLCKIKILDCQLALLSAGFKGKSISKAQMQVERESLAKETKKIKDKLIKEMNIVTEHLNESLREGEEESMMQVEPPDGGKKASANEKEKMIKECNRILDKLILLGGK